MVNDKRKLYSFCVYGRGVVRYGSMMLPMDEALILSAVDFSGRSYFGCDFDFRFPKVGDFALFLQTPMGMVLFIGLPLLAFIIYDIIRRQQYARKESKKTAELEAELERLRKLAGERESQ